MRGFCRQRSWDWKQRGHPVYRIRQVRFPLSSTVDMQAGNRTTEVKRGSAGGGWSGHTGDGEAWLQRGNSAGDRGFFRRPIRKGRWAGPWQLVNEEDDQ